MSDFDKEDVQIIVSVLVGLGTLVQQIVGNWNKTDYQPVMPEELEQAIKMLSDLPDLTDKYGK